MNRVSLGVDRGNGVTGVKDIVMLDVQDGPVFGAPGFEEVGYVLYEIWGGATAP